MADIKSRRPYRLSDKDYDEWFTRWVAWFLAFPDTVEFANWLRPDLYDLDADFYDKLVAVGAAKIAQDKATEIWSEAVKNLRQLLVKLRISLPTLTPGDDSVLDTLNLRGEVPPRDADDLVHYAQLVDDAWQPLSGDPQYAPFAGRLNLIAPSITDINDKRVVMGQAILDYSTACDEKTAARDACNTRERAVFNFFRGEGKPDEFWTSSVYGLGTGGEEPGVTKWDARPIAKIWKAPSPLTGLLAGCEKYDGTDRFDIRIAYAKKNEPPPDMPNDDYATDVEQPVLLGLPLEKSMYYMWIRARKGGEVSEWSDVASIEWVE